jgi:hypothetical protein
MTAGYALSLDGNGYAQRTSGITGLTSGSHDFTMATWAKFPSLPSSGSLWALMTIGTDGTGGRPFFAVNNNAGTYRFVCSIYGGDAYINYAFAINTWYHFVLTFTASTKTFEVYVNGASIGTTTTATTPNFGTGKICIGCDAGAGAGSRGPEVLDDCRYYESKLTAGNVTTLYNSGAGTTSAVGSAVGWYMFDGSSYVDSSGNSNTLTAGGTGNSFVQTYAPGQAISFSGSGYASAASSTGITSGNHDFTQAYWIKVITAPASTATQTHACFGSSGTRTGPWIGYFNNSGTYQISAGLGGDTVNFNQTLVLNVWYYIVRTYTASTKTTQVFVNGTSIGSTAHSANAAISGTGISIGRYFASSDYTIGYIDDYRYFESVLSGGNITTLLNSGNGTNAALGGEKHWYLFDNTVNDSSGNANTLTLGGSGNSYETGVVPAVTSTVIADSLFFGGGI